MIIFRKAKELSQYIQQQKKAGLKTGFVPTMGALHQGHLSLVETCKNENDLTICSIFVNPAQFNNAEDLKHYPVTTEKDIEQLVCIHCDVLFLPAVEEMYPPGHQLSNYPIGHIERILEGLHRPGHFQGVCQAVDRLLQIADPDQLYLGQKDFQQCIVIKKLLEITNRKDQINLRIVPTVRETDGLAMSSRNLRLSQEQRKTANTLYKELKLIKENIYKHSIEQLKQAATEHLTSKGFKVDYVEIANAQDLTSATGTSGKMVALAAATTGNIRLIDNLVLN